MAVKQGPHKQYRKPNTRATATTLHRRTPRPCPHCNGSTECPGCAGSSESCGQCRPFRAGECSACSGTGEA